MNTGNNVADYIVTKAGCADCSGTGILVSREEILNFVSGCRLSYARKVVKSWKNNGFITCEACHGTGEVEAWR